MRLSHRAQRRFVCELVVDVVSFCFGGEVGGTTYLVVQSFFPGQ